MEFREAYVCNIGRTHDLSRRMNKRRYPSQKLPVGFTPRPVQTKRVKFPMLDARKKSNVLIENRGVFSEKRTFAPGNLAPFNGYMASVDDESKLYNIVFPTQKGLQSKFIPGMTSDLFRNDAYVVGRQENNPYPGLFEQQNFNEFMPNRTTEIGFENFYNHTRQQTKNLKCDKNI
tara:strand:+ start:2547 stop:3071 length:525 start_codon:yes stop_codon:yes gene_type:complete